MTSACVNRGATSNRSRERSAGDAFTSAMPQLPDRHRAIGGVLIDMFVAAEARLDIGTVERRSRREAVDAAAAPEEDEIDEDVPLGANLRFIPRFPQDPAGGEAPARAETRPDRKRD